MKNLLILLFLILSVAGNAYSQVPPAAKPVTVGAMIKTGVIKGKIIDADTNTPMEYANIAIYNKKDSKLVTGGIANAAGDFEIADLPFGVYYVEAKFIGFEKTTINDIKIIPNSTTVDLGTIKLAVSTQKIGTIDVVADRARIEYKIDKKVINVSQDINSAGGTAVTVLENTPSVEVDIDGNVSLRGSTSFTVLIDGRPSVLTGSDALKQIPSSVIENIEIITNPSVKYDPDGQAGIINIVMKKNLISGFNGIVNVNGGSRNQFGTDLTMNYKTKKYNLFLAANWDAHTDYGTQKSSRETFATDTTLTTFLDSEGKRNQTRGGQQLKLGFDYFLTKNTSVTVSGSVGKFNFNGDGSGTITKYTLPATIDSFLISENNSTRKGYTRSADASFLSKLNGDGTHKLEGTFTYRHRNGTSNDNTNEFLSDPTYAVKLSTISQVATNDTSKSDDYRMKIDYTLPFGSGNKFEAGIQSRMERETEDFNFTNFGVNNPDFTSGMKYKEDIHSAYSTFSGSLSSIQYMLGLRGEYNLRSIEDSKNPIPYKLNKFDLFPSAHFSYELPSKNQLMASYSRRVNRPDGRDLDPFPSYMSRYAIRTGNPALKPEYSDSYELSYISNFGKSFISFETFYRSTNNLMYRSTNTVNSISYMTIKNLNSDFSLGGEIMGNIEANKWLLINTSFSLYNYQLKGVDMGKSIDKQSTNYSGRFNTTFKFTANSRLQLTANYRGPSTSVQGDQKGMMFTNVSFRQDFMKKKLTATFVIRDVLGTAKFEGTSFANGSQTTFRMQRDPRVMSLTLSYRINNYKLDKQPASSDQPSQGTEELF